MTKVVPMLNLPLACSDGTTNFLGRALSPISREIQINIVGSKQCDLLLRKTFFFFLVNVMTMKIHHLKVLELTKVPFAALKSFHGFFPAMAGLVKDSFTSPFLKDAR